MTRSRLLHPQGDQAIYACPACGGRLEMTCGCGRTWDDWVHVEEVIALAAPQRAAAAAPEGGARG
jgi:hypothetical protein